jgi:hypothetical protein
MARIVKASLDPYRQPVCDESTLRREAGIMGYVAFACPILLEVPDRQFFLEVSSDDSGEMKAADTSDLAAEQEPCMLKTVPNSRQSYKATCQAADESTAEIECYCNRVTGPSQEHI